MSEIQLSIEFASQLLAEMEGYVPSSAWFCPPPEYRKERETQVAAWQKMTPEEFANSGVWTVDRVMRVVSNTDPGSSDGLRGATQTRRDTQHVFLRFNAIPLGWYFKYMSPPEYGKTFTQNVDDKGQVIAPFFFDQFMPHVSL